MLRFAPSPTGFLHIGNARVAVLNFLYAKKLNKDFFLRIDDTDQERSKAEYTESILDDLKWLGIEYKKVIKQSDRMRIYWDTFEFLKNKNFIYPCFETQEELLLKRKVLLKQGKPPIYDRAALSISKNELSSLLNSGKLPHWRLKLDDEPIEWVDGIHGKIKFNNLSVSDPVVFRSDKLPLFTLTSVVDDAEFNVTNILRGDDHITNTAAQIKLFKCLGSSIPSFSHFPLMRSKSGEGLSKRLNSFSIKEMRNKKIPPLIIINYLQKIGSSFSIDTIESIKDLIKNYNLEAFSRNSVLFNEDDLFRLNSKYIKSMKYEELGKISEIKIKKDLWEIIKLNINELNEIEEWQRVFEKECELPKVKVAPIFFDIIIKTLPKEINSSTWGVWTEKIQEEYQKEPKQIFLTLRKILTGKSFGPSMKELLTLFSREEILKRINNNSEKQ